MNWCSTVEPLSAPIAVVRTCGMWNQLLIAMYKPRAELQGDCGLRDIVQYLSLLGYKGTKWLYGSASDSYVCMASYKSSNLSEI